MSRPKRIIVLGSIRSGTSMVMGILSRCGVATGKVRGPGRWCLKGYYENPLFCKIHRETFAANGGHVWMPPAQVSEIPAKCLRDAAKAILGAQGGLWGWKDPRASLMVDFWREQLRDYDLRFIFAWRPKQDVIQSVIDMATDFEQVHGTPKGVTMPKTYELAERLVDRYWKGPIANEGAPDFYLTDYTKYFDTPKAELAAMLDWLEIPMPKDTGDIERFIDPALCHYAS